VRKGRTIELAEQTNITCRRLPIQELVPRRQSHILNIDTVVKILCSYMVSEDWYEAIMAHMPMRRQVKNRRKHVGGEDISEGEGTEDAEEDEIFSESCSQNATPQLSESMEDDSEITCDN
jgi:hypothetical protein